MVEKGHGQLVDFFSLVGGESTSGSNYTGVYVLMGNILLISPTWQEFQNLQNNSKILFYMSLDGEPGPCSKAAVLFILTVPSLSLHLLPSLINSYLYLLAGTQGRSRKLNEAYFFGEEIGTQTGSCAQEHHRVLHNIKIIMGQHT